MKWSTRIRELQDAGLTLSAIADRIGVTTSAVGDIATGRSKSPRGEAALKLDRLHRERCPQSPTEAA